MRLGRVFRPGSNRSDPGAGQSSEPIIKLRDLVKVYQTGVGGFTAIDGISLDIHQGEFLGIVGKSGAGKTTLLNLISGVSGLTSGKVIFHSNNGSAPAGHRDAVSVGAMSEDEMAVWRGSNIGIVYRKLGDYGRAEELLREALEIREGELGAVHEEVADSLKNLAGKAEQAFGGIDRRCTAPPPHLMHCTEVLER